jgi:hypothetical protein
MAQVKVVENHVIQDPSFRELSFKKASPRPGQRQQYGRASTLQYARLEYARKIDFASFSI